MKFKMKLDSVNEFIRPPMVHGESGVHGYSMTFMDANRNMDLGTFAVLSLDSSVKKDREKFIVGEVYNMEITLKAEKA